MYVHMFCGIFISDVMRLVHKTKVNKKTKQAHLYKFIYLKGWGVGGCDLDSYICLKGKFDVDGPHSLIVQGTTCCSCCSGKKNKEI